MDIAEAKAKLEAVLDELAEAGFSVWGWDDGSIQIAHLNEPSIACAPRHVSLDVRRDANRDSEEVREGRERLRAPRRPLFHVSKHETIALC
jgi:hypothetical protein